MPDAKRRSRTVAALARRLGSSALAGGTLLAAGSRRRPGRMRGKLTGWEKLMPQVYADAAKPDSRRYTWREPSPTVKQDFRKLSAERVPRRVRRRLRHRRRPAPRAASS